MTLLEFKEGNVPPPSGTRADVEPQERREPSRRNGSVRFEVRDYGDIGEARRKLRTLLDDLRVAEGDDALLVLSELVTNAVQHGGGGCTVEISLAQGCLHLDVYDTASAPPILANPEPNDLGGRGLRIVDAVAVEWGWQARTNGKRVWADIALG